MSFLFKIIAILFAILFFIIFITFARNKSVKPFYSVIWLVMCIFLFSVTIFEKQVKWFSGQLGLSDASFLIVSIFISFLLFYVMYLSLKISEMGDRIQELISINAILEKRLRDIEKNKE